MKSSDAVQAGIILVCGLVSAAAGVALTHSRQASGQGLEDVLGVGLSLLGVVIVGLWLLALAVAVVAQILERRGLATAGTFAERCTPAFMRRLAAALLGVQLLAVPAVAQAGAGGPDAGTGSAVAGSAVLPAPGPASDAGTGSSTDTCDGARSPSSSPLAASIHADGQDGEHMPPAPPEPVSPAWEPAPMPVEAGLLVRPDTRRTAAAEVVVAPGDSLWSIAAGRLGPLATAADVAEAWPAWFDANRPVIGDDPSLLLPGQVLRAPSP